MKHKPATPLPWHLGVKQAEQIVYDTKGWAVANATVFHDHTGIGESKDNARYIAHAANAYPGDVETLRFIAQQGAFLTQEGNPLAAAMADKARARLRELGEEQ